MNPQSEKSKSIKAPKRAIAAFALSAMSLAGLAASQDKQPATPAEPVVPVEQGYQPALNEQAFVPNAYDASVPANHAPSPSDALHGLPLGSTGQAPVQPAELPRPLNPPTKQIS